MKYTKLVCLMFAAAVLLVSCGANPAGPWYDRGEESTQYVLTLGTDNDESFFQVAKLQDVVWVVEAWQGTWEVESRGKLKITITEKWDGIEVINTTSNNKWVDHSASWTWEFEKKGSTLTVTPSADFNGGEPITLTESDELVHFRSATGSL